MVSLTTLATIGSLGVEEPTEYFVLMTFEVLCEDCGSSPTTSRIRGSAREA